YQLFFLVSGTLGDLLLFLPFGEHEVVVITEGSPRTRRHVVHFHELPVGNVSWLERQIVPNRRRYVETRAPVQIRLRFLVLKHILIMVGAKWAAIFPLRVTGPIPFTNRNP